MPYNDFGRFFPAISYQVDRTNGIGPQAERFDSNFQDVADGLSTAICKDGQTVVAHDIPFAGKKITFLGNPAALTDACNYGSALNSCGQIYSVTNPTYGAKGDGLADDTAAVQAAMTAACAVKGVLYFPQGTYKLTDALTCSGAITIAGSGPNSILRWVTAATGQGIAVTQPLARDFLYVKDLKFVTEKTGGTALYLDSMPQAIDISPDPQGMVVVDRVHSRMLVDNCHFSNAGLLDSGDVLDGKGWTTCIDINGAIYVVVRACNFCGIADTPYRGTTTHGIYFHGTPSDQYSNGHPVTLKVSSCTFTFCVNGVYAYNCEGVYVDQCDAVACDYGYSVKSDIGHPQVNICNSHANCYSASIVVDGQWGTSIVGCLLYGIQTNTGWVGIYMTGNGNVGSIVGNSFCVFGTVTQNGIVVDHYGYLAISNNAFQTVDVMNSCIVLTANSGHCKGSNNIYHGTPTVATVSDSGTANSVT